MHFFAVAALDQPVHDPFVRVAAEIGPQEGERRNALRVGFQLAAQRRQDLVELAQLLGREAAGTVRRQDQDVDQPIGKPDRHRHIIGRPFIDEVPQNRKIELRVRTFEPAPDAAFAGDDRRERAFPVLCALETLMGGLKLVDAFDIALPGIGVGEELRVQGANEQAQAPNREIHGNQRIREPGQEIRRRSRLPGVGDKPFDKRIFRRGRIAARLLHGHIVADEPRVHRGPIEGDIVADARRFVVGILVGPDRIFRRPVADLERPVGGVSLERAMRPKFVAQQELGAHVGERKVVHRRQPGFVHQQGARAVGNRLAVEDDANPVAARLDDDAIAVMRDVL